MKRNRYIIAYVLLAFALSSIGCGTEPLGFTGTVTIHPVHLEQVGDSLYRNGYGVGRCKDGTHLVALIGFPNWFLHHVLLVDRVFH